MNAPATVPIALPRPAEEANAAEDDGSDRGQHEHVPGRCIAGGRRRGEEEPAGRSEGPAEDVRTDLRCSHANTVRTCGFLVVADGEDVDAQPGATKDEPDDDDQSNERETGRIIRIRKKLRVVERDGATGLRKNLDR